MSDRRETFTLCADDFAISEGVSRAILDLVDAGRLTAVSAMSSLPLWAETARDLSARRGRVAVGLHLDLTHGPFDRERSAFDLKRLILGSLSRQPDLRVVVAEFERQFDRFETAFGHPPDHVDGHHHVHALPGLRSALFKVLQRRFVGLPAFARPLLRDPSDAMAHILSRDGACAKALTVAVLSGGFGAQAAALGFATNVGFAGFSRFSGGGHYEKEFAEFLKARGSRHLIMCHPGLEDDAQASRDSIASARAEEYVTLMSNPICRNGMLRVLRNAEQVGGAYSDFEPARA